MPRERVALQHLWQRNSRQRRQQQHEYRDRIPPEPRCAPVQPAQAPLNFLVFEDFRFGRLWFAAHPYQLRPHFGFGTWRRSSNCDQFGTVTVSSNFGRKKFGSDTGTRTRISALRGPCANHLHHIAVGGSCFSSRVVSALVTGSLFEIDSSIPTKTSGSGTLGCSLSG